MIKVCLLISIGPAAWDDSQTLILPKHLFIYESPKEFWVGMCMFVMVLSGPCIQSRLVSSCNELIHAIVNALDCHASNSVVFWPALQCLSTLLDQLGSRFWQFVPPTCNFDYVLKCILESHHFEDELNKWREESCEPNSPENAHYSDDTTTNSQVVYELLEERLDAKQPVFPLDVPSVNSLALKRTNMRRLPFTWIVPFLQSLLDFDETAFKAIETLFHAVHSFPNHGGKRSLLFNKSLFTLSQMVELLFSKRAFSVMYKFKNQWLPAMEIALMSVKVSSCLTSMIHMFMVLLGILDTKEAKHLSLNEKVVSYLRNFTPSLMSLSHKHPKHDSSIPVKKIIEHVTNVLEILATTYVSPTLTMDELTELPAMEGKEQEHCHEGNTFT